MDKVNLLSMFQWIIFLSFSSSLGRLATQHSRKIFKRWDNTRSKNWKFGLFQTWRAKRQNCIKTRLQAVLPGNRCLRRPAASLCERKLSDTSQEIYLTQLFVCGKKYLIVHIFTSFVQEDTWWIPFRPKQASPLRPCTQARWWPWNQVPSLKTLSQSSKVGHKL